MKARLLFGTLAATATIILLQSYSGGPAEGGARATGAPGGSNSTCVACHGGGAFGTISVDFTMIDENGNTKTEYTPDSTYDITVTVNHSSGSPQGFGFQMICLDDNDNNYDGWDSASNNAQLTTLSGRDYVEHDALSTSEEFTVEWTAPSENTGDVTFYIGANAVNGNGTSSGDGAVTDEFKIEEKENEGEPNGLTDLPDNTLKVFPIPTQGLISIEGQKQGETFSLFNLNGTMVKHFTAGTKSMDLSALSSGIYIIQSDFSGTRRLVVKE